MGIGLVWFKQDKIDAAEGAFDNAIGLNADFSQLIENYKKENDLKIGTIKLTKTELEGIKPWIDRKKEETLPNPGFERKLLYSTPTQLQDPVDVCLDVGELQLAIKALEVTTKKMGEDLSSNSELKEFYQIASFGEKLNGMISPKMGENQLFMEGRYLFYTGRSTQAESKIREAIMIQSNNVEIWVILAEILKRLGREEELIETFEKIIKLDPDNLYARLGLANSLENEGKWKEAQKIYKKLLNLTVPPKEVFTGLARTYLEQGKPGEAEQVIGIAARFRPDVAYLWFLLGTYLLENGKYTQAAPYLRKAWVMEPVNHIYQWAVETIDDILSGKINLSDPQFAKKSFPRGLVKLIELDLGTGIQFGANEQGPYFGAKGVRLIPSLNQYTPLTSKNLEFRNELNLGVEEARNCNLEKAEKIFLNIHDLHPHEKIPLINLVVCLMHQGNLRKAESLLTPFVEKNPGDPDPWILLGHVFNEQKRFADAYERYLHAIMFLRTIDRYGAINLNINEIWKKISKYGD